VSRNPEAQVWFKHRAWIPVAWILSIINLGAVWFAAQPAEPWHATLHGVLGTLFALGAQRLVARRRALALAGGETGLRTGITTLRDELAQLGPSVGDDRIERLQQAVDAIAVEVERVSEGQRFVTKLLSERPPERERSPAAP
jgi:hypothetical protein